MNQTNDPFQKTALQIAGILGGGMQLAGEGITGGLNAIQQGAQMLFNPQKPLTNPLKPQQVLAAQMTPTPTMTPAQHTQFINNWKTVNPGAQQVALQAATKLLTPTPSPQEISEPPKGASDYEVAAAPIFQKYGIPPAAGLGIYAMEGRGKTINPNNPYNIGAIDSNPLNANAYHFQNPLQGTEEAAKFLAGQSPYQTSQVQKVFQSALAKLRKTNDVEGYLEDIAPTYSTNKNYVKTILQTPEFQRWAGNN